MSLSKRALFAPQRTLAFGSIGAGYTAIGTAIPYPIRILTVNNLTNGDLQFSIDGITDHFAVGRGGGVVYDIAGNRTGVSDELYLAENTTLYVKQIEIPTEGSVYVSVVYGRND